MYLRKRNYFESSQVQKEQEKSLATKETQKHREKERRDPKEVR